MHAVIQEHIALLLRNGIYVPLRAYPVRHMQVAVLRHQRCVPSGRYLPVVVNNDILPVCACFILRIGSLQRNIALFRRGLAEDFNLTVSGFQIHVFFCRHGLYRRSVITYMDVAILRLHRYAALFRGYRLLNVHISFAGFSNDITLRFYITSSCRLISDCDISFSSRHNRIMARG